MNKFTSFLVGFIGGTAAGAVLGLLYAPEKGKNVRGKLSYQLSKNLEKIKKMSEPKEEFANEAAEQGKKHVEQTKQKTEVLSEEFKKLEKQMQSSKPKTKKTS